MIAYTIAPLAQNDLDEIWSYIAYDSLTAADRMIALLREKFLLLASQPLIGQDRPELAADIRSFSVGSYAVFYKYLRDGIEIARVIHSARDVVSQF